MKAHTYVRQNKYKNDHAIIMATRKKNMIDTQKNTQLG